MEKRHSKRIALEIPVQAGAESGILRDISEGGVYFITSGSSYQVGGEVRFSFELKHVVPEKPLRLSFLGHVIRMENLGDKFGVAATIDKYNCLH